MLHPTPAARLLYANGNSSEFVDSTLQSECPAHPYLRSALSARLSPRRFAHTLGVEETAAKLAELYLPAAGITLSTRERPFLRDRLIGLGITKISAGVSTAVGGHAHAAQDVAEEHDTAQFEIADDRDVDQMIAAIEAQGYQPVCKSWEPLDEAYACGKSA